MLDLPCVGGHDLDRDPDIAKDILVALEHPLGRLEVVLPVAFRHLGPDLLEGEGTTRLQQERDEVHQTLERVHRCGMILGPWAANGRASGCDAGTVVSVGASRPGAVELEVEVDGQRAPALAYPDLTGPIRAGDLVLLNTTAVALGLGTGGFHLVIAVEGERATELSHGGRVMKARYTPQQVAVRSVEETHRDVLEGSRGPSGDAGRGRTRCTR